MRMTSCVGRLAPLGVFPLTASASGTAPRPARTEEPLNDVPLSTFQKVIRANHGVDHPATNRISDYSGSPMA